MRQLSSLSLILIAAVSVSALYVDCFAYQRHQKTKASLPHGAPLPDVEIALDDSILANVAHKKALKCLSDSAEGDAAEYFERAIAALRRSKGLYSKTVVRQIVLDYGLLLRAHTDQSKALQLEQEFKITESDVEKNQRKVFRNFSVKDFFKFQPGTNSRKQLRLTAEQSHVSSKDRKLYLLSKPNGRNIVSVVSIFGDEATLNPDHLSFDYGPIPPLRFMDVSVADSLWGAKEFEFSKAGQSEIERIYELRSTNMNGKKISKEKFYIDAVFLGTKLQKYRVRSKDEISGWQVVCR
jgi:hypothetical protein